MNVTNNSVQRRNRFPLRSFAVSNFTTLKSVTSVSGFSFQFPENGVGRSFPFSSVAPEKSKRKIIVKAVAVRGKDTDKVVSSKKPGKDKDKGVSSKKPAAKEVNNVDLGKTGLSQESKSDKQDSKINASKTKKKPVQSKKKDVKTSAATDSSKVVAKEVSRKSSSKGKKTILKVSN